jgi:long-chain acyl-CoA synthetase
MSEPRPWLKNYPQGVPANINPEAYPNLNAFIKEACAKFHDRPAFCCMDKVLTFQQIDKQSTQLAAYLQSRGLVPGDRVGIMMPNLLQYPIAIFGCIKAGLIAVNTNPLYTPREMLYQFKDSDIRGIIIAENFAANLRKILPELNINTIIVTSIGELLGVLKGSIVNFVVRNIKRMVPQYQLDNAVSFKDAVHSGKKFSIKPFPDEPERVLVHQYTGGTTGVSKGAMLTNRNLVANMLQIEAVLCSSNFKEGEEVALCPLPMYHIFAFTFALAMVSQGAMTILVVNARDLPSVLKEFNKHKVSIMVGVNTLFNALLNHKDFPKCNFSDLRITAGGGMAVQNPVANKWQVMTGCYLTQAYGLTETSPGAAINRIDGKGRLGSIGLPVPSTDMRVVDEQGNVLGVNEVGEIQIKGPQVMKGYFNKPEETARVLNDGWFATGDIGKWDEEGYFYIVDRKKDMILVSGFNVYPNEIEEYVAGHPKVLEAAAIGVPDEKSGEVVKVFVVKKEKSLTEKELVEFCRLGLTGYKIPKHVEFRTELPKTNVGKILRRALREEEGK